MAARSFFFLFILNCRHQFWPILICQWHFHLIIGKLFSFPAELYPILTNFSQNLDSFEDYLKDFVINIGELLSISTNSSQNLERFGCWATFSVHFELLSPILVNSDLPMTFSSGDW